MNYDPTDSPKLQGTERLFLDEIFILDESGNNICSLCGDFSAHVSFDENGHPTNVYEITYHITPLDKSHFLYATVEKAFLDYGHAYDHSDRIEREAEQDFHYA
jgi:hypothetical protein